HAWVFGSRAKGGTRLDSDLDVGVRLAPSDGKILAEWIFSSREWRCQLNELVDGGPRIDLQLADPVYSADIVWPAILDHGILIYETGNK
ncbi:MAG: nucleotidyltransferase domain-containing protein, partial [Gemmobacter sp.]